ncbi:Tim10/DDP family zinc finger-domain-containing protein [Gilbertella persicaria]|uniref:Tim10/DDP family zinc finger-domain-containing protein n=1 Tax=Gilbertella persicaria TaxID=101096 RepID=UPI00221E9FDB|nr:Tim10/DDP family zinc finger-domain-containing protein [Gilbertella persicaria]KAI8075402.1 Tim10/DDP family zinc finger-domain-containing protein [Gilbertella persicaria]
MDYSKYNFAEQAQINAMMEQRQMNDFVNMFTGLVDRCFKQCANDFTTKAVTGREAACVNKCAERFLKHSELVSKRFGEISQQQSAFIDVLNQSINPSSL